MKRRTILGLLIAVIAIVAVFTCWNWPRSDESLSKAIVGTWRATDLSNGALHKRSEGVKDELASFQPDGTLIYTVESQANERPTTTETWGWRVEKGRLQVRYQDQGEGDTGTWMPQLKISVSDTNLTIYRKNYPSKEFIRINAAIPVTSRPV